MKTQIMAKAQIEYEKFVRIYKRLYRFNRLSLAETFEARTTKRYMIVQGDYKEYWVAPLADAIWLLGHGYEAAE